MKNSEILSSLSSRKPTGQRGGNESPCRLKQPMQLPCDQDTFERTLAAMYDAMLDDARWPVTSARIDEACGIKGNHLLVGEGPMDDRRVRFVGIYGRGQRPRRAGTGRRPGGEALHF